VSQKKFPTFKLSVTLNLGMLMHYLGKLKTRILCRYLANVEENANKLHFKKLPTFEICRSTSLLQIQTSYKNLVLVAEYGTMLIVDQHCSDVCCDKFPVPQIDRKSKRTMTWKILFVVSIGKDTIF